VICTGLPYFGPIHDTRLDEALKIATADFSQVNKDIYASDILRVVSFQKGPF
jgi:hypothetical protein